MSLSSKLRKITKMPPAEIRCRVGERVRAWSDRRSHRRSVNVVGNVKNANGGARIAKRLFEKAFEMAPGHSPTLLDELRSDHSSVYQSLLNQNRRRVETLDQGTYQVLGHKVDLSGAIDWSRDPVTGYAWPKRFYADVAVYDADSPADVKYVWEINRHQFLVELAQGWLLTGDERIASRVRELIIDWIENNRLYDGVNWTSGLEVAMRGVAWLWALSALSAWGGWQEGDRDKIAESLADHAVFLSRHLSFFTSPYNHLIGEATTLFLLGSWLNEHPQAKSWRTVSRRVLEEHGPAQFYDDGFCVEQATSYHFYTLGFLSLAVVEARRQNKPLSLVETACSKAFSAASCLRQPDGCWPQIGDLDSARSLPVIPENFWDFGSLLTLGAVLFDLPELIDQESTPGGEITWLLGAKGVEKFIDLRQEAQTNHPIKDNSRVAALPCSGYLVAQSNDGPSSDWLLFDAGPLAHGVHRDATPSTAHGHADVMNLLLSLDGRPMLVDSGLPFYAGDPAWVEYFRGPAAHNTIEVEGAPWAKPTGRLSWSHVQDKPSLESNLSDNLWVVRAILELPHGVTIERNVLGLPGEGVWIADLVKCDAPRAARWFWQTPAARQPRLGLRDPSFAEIELDGGLLNCWTDELGWKTSLSAASDGSPVAWQAPGYGELVAGHRIEFEASPTTERLVVTNIARTSAIAKVQVGERRLTCVRPGESSLAVGASDIAFPKQSEVSWQIETPSGCLLVAVGGSSETHSQRTTSEWQEVHGLGSLRVATKRVALAKSSQDENRTHESERTANAINIGSSS